MSNHTPGPWEFNGGYIFGADKNETVIADIYRSDVSDEGTWERNGKLIAAAPELFEALKGLLTACVNTKPFPEALRAAQDALVKAAGKDW